MINLKYIKNQKFSEAKLVEILFYTFPLWFIVGNLAVSINTLLFIVASLFLIQKKQLTFRFNNSSWFLLAFFLYFFVSTTIQFQRPGLLYETIQNWSLENNPIFKSFLLIRFPILIFVVDTLFFNKILNLKKLFFSSLLCTSFVCFDIVLQYITGFDLFGYKRQGSWNMGPFGDEWIAGSYLKNFSFFSFFYIFVTLKNKKISNLILVTIVALHMVAILLSGNKMPMILFLFGCVLIFFLIKDLRFALSLGLLFFLSAFFLLVNYDNYENKNYYKASYKAFINDINIKKFIKVNKKDDSIKKDTDEKKLNEYQGGFPEEIILLKHSGYNRIFYTAIKMWKDQPLVGFGFKSFRIKCWDMLEKDNEERKITKKPQFIVCANHPHNYYLELLSEAGIIGTSLMIIFFLILLKSSYDHLKKYYHQKDVEMNLLIPVIILFFLEIWPLKSTGSFFTTWGATFFWLNIGLLLSTQWLFKTKNAN